jgi:hypothetical protein
VDGLIPSVEFTPVFSGTDWARTGVAKERATAAVARILYMKASLGCVLAACRFDVPR